MNFIKDRARGVVLALLIGAPIYSIANDAIPEIQPWVGRDVLGGPLTQDYLLWKAARWFGWFLIGVGFMETVFPGWLKDHPHGSKAYWISERLNAIFVIVAVGIPLALFGNELVTAYEPLVGRRMFASSWAFEYLLGQVIRLVGVLFILGGLAGSLFPQWFDDDHPSEPTAKDTLSGTADTPHVNTLQIPSQPLVATVAFILSYPLYLFAANDTWLYASVTLAGLATGIAIQVVRSETEDAKLLGAWMATMGLGTYTLFLILSVMSILPVIYAKHTWLPVIAPLVTPTFRFGLSMFVVVVLGGMVNQYRPRQGDQSNDEFHSYET